MITGGRVLDVVVNIFELWPASFKQQLPLLDGV